MAMHNISLDLKVDTDNYSPSHYQQRKIGPTTFSDGHAELLLQIGRLIMKVG